MITPVLRFSQSNRVDVGQHSLPLTFATPIAYVIIAAYDSFSAAISTYGDGNNSMSTYW